MRARLYFVNMSMIEENYTIREAAMAAELSVSAVRSWIDEKKVLLKADEDDSRAGHRQLDYYDVFRIGLTGHLVKSNVPVKVAWELSTATIDKFRLLGDHMRLSGPAMAAGLFGESMLFIERSQDGELTGKVVKDFERDWRTVRNKYFRPKKNFAVVLAIALSPFFERMLRNLGEV